MSSPDWIKTRLDLRPQSQGFAFLDQASLAPYIAATMSAAVPQDGAWQNSVTFATNVSNYVDPIRYRKNSHGQVEVEGRWFYSGGTASSANLFQLPVGYRPVSDGAGLNIPRNIPNWVQNGNRSASYWAAGLTNVYEIVSPICWLTIGTDGWISIAAPIWGQLSRVGGNPDGGFDMNGQWKSWGQVPWDGLAGRIYNFRFPTD